MRMVVAASRAQGVAGAASRIDDDVVGEHAGALGREAELREEAEHVRLVRGGGGVALSGDLVELRVRVLAARAEAVVPDVERLELASQAGVGQGWDPRDERGGQYRFGTGPHTALRGLRGPFQAAGAEG